MGKYFCKRVASAIPLLLVISFVVFMFIHMIPGDPARMIAGQDATKEDVEVVREQLGLNEPLLVQYGHYMKGLFTGDLGDSVKNGKTVVETIAPRLKPTIMLDSISYDLGNYHRYCSGYHFCSIPWKST